MSGEFTCMNLCARNYFVPYVVSYTHRVGLEPKHRSTCTFPRVYLFLHHVKNNHLRQQSPHNLCVDSDCCDKNADPQCNSALYQLLLIFILQQILIAHHLHGKRSADPLIIYRLSRTDNDAFLLTTLRILTIRPLQQCFYRRIF